MTPVAPYKLRLFVSSGLLIKSGEGSGKKIANQAGYYLLDGHWRKLQHNKPAPKHAPQAAHPQSAGVHTPAAHFTPDQWELLKLPDSNVNASSFNNGLSKLKAMSDAGDVTGILGASYGSNTYGAKLAKVANTLLGMYGSTHKVTPGQKPGTHAAVLGAPVATHPSGLPDHLAPKAAAPAPLTDEGTNPPPVAAPGSDLKEVKPVDYIPPVESSVAAAPAPVSIVPWDKLMLADSNSNAASNNKKIAAIKAMAEAGDVAGLQALKFGSNGYAIKQKLAAASVIEFLTGKTSAVEAVQSLKDYGPAPAPAPTPAADWTLDTVVAAPALKPLDHGELNIPGKTNNINAQLDKYKAEQAKSTKVEAKTATTKKKSDKSEAKKLFAEYGPAILEKYGEKFGKKELKNELDQTVKWEPSKFIDLVNKFKSEQTAAVVVPDAVATVPASVKVPSDIFHNTDAGHSKFWSVSTHGAVMKTVFGKIGTQGQTSEKVFSSPAAAVAGAYKVSAEKVKKGYWTNGSGMHEYAAAPLDSAEIAPATLEQADTQKDGDTKQGADGMLVFKDGHWHKVEASVSTNSTEPSIDTWEQTGQQGGSNPGGRFKDTDGVEWYCKFPADVNHAHSEVLAAKLYEAAGLAGQDCKLITKGGKIGIASRWVEVKTGTADELKATPGAQAGFVVDAWLANHDVVGMGYDNLQIGADGQAMRVDAGGSLQYRAMGAKKEFGPVVGEIESMLDAKINPYSASVFGGLTKADMTASAKKVLGVTDEKIYNLVMEHGPGDSLNKATLIEALIARKEDIAKRFPKAAPKVAAIVKQDPTKLKVLPDQLPKPHDFQNFKGAGAALSSKAHINESNQAAESALLDFALKGNLIALKDYHYDAIDKETGISQGNKPIGEHPSSHVKTYWSDLVSTLSYIANPPAALKKFHSVITTSISKISQAFKSAQYGVTTAKADANSRLAFWIALGSAKPVENLLPAGASLAFQSSPVGMPKITPAMNVAAQTAYQALASNRLVKRFINGVQGSGTYNDNFRDGRLITADGKDAVGMNLDAHSYATEKPEGLEIYKWINFPGAMGKQMLATPAGTVFQNPGSMCCSTGPTSTQGFGSDRMRIRYAKGAKAVDSYGSGNHSGEKEITTLPGQRYVILKCHKVMCPIKGKERIELDVLMLPPDPTYLSELEAMKATNG